MYRDGKFEFQIKTSNFSQQHLKIMDFKKFLTNSWTVTLTATMIGVFAGIYFNNAIENRKIEREKRVALKNIQQEISSNQESLDSTIVDHENLVKIFDFMNKYINDDSDLIISPEKLNEFRRNHPNIISVSDSTKLENGLYNYEGEMNPNFKTPQMNFSNVARQTLTSSGLLQQFEYEDMLYINSIDKIEQEVIQGNVELLRYFTGKEDMGEDQEIMLTHLKLLIDFEKSLLIIYEKQNEIFQN